MTKPFRTVCAAAFLILAVLPLRSVAAQVPRFTKIDNGDGSPLGFYEERVLFARRLPDLSVGVYLFDGQSSEQIQTVTPPQELTEGEFGWFGGTLSVRAEPGGIVGDGGGWLYQDDLYLTASFTYREPSWQLEALGASCCSSYETYPFSSVSTAAWGSGGLVLQGVDASTNEVGLYLAGEREPFLKLGAASPSGALVERFVAVKAVPGGELIVLKVAAGGASKNEIYLHRNGGFEHVLTWPMQGGPEGSDQGEIQDVATTGSYTVLSVGAYASETALFAVSQGRVRPLAQGGVSDGILTTFPGLWVDGTTTAFVRMKRSSTFVLDPSRTELVVARADGTLTVLLAKGDSLDGKTIDYVYMGRGPLFHAGRIAATISFTDGSLGMYLLDVPAPAAATAVPAAGGRWLLLLAAGLSVLVLHGARRTRSVAALRT